MQVPAYLVPYDGRNDALLKRIFARTNRRAGPSRLRGLPGPARACWARVPSTARDDLAQMGYGPIDARQVEAAQLAVTGEPGGSLERTFPRRKFERCSTGS